ncbi:MAG: NHLP bacteriocin export ABC transporter permease/ATPase subunit [Syntrophales bacterium]|nr:NHLP bacteriocin export ABC transporter permease/ATPase subunit [Syntrophales bacterium]
MAAAPDFWLQNGSVLEAETNAPILLSQGQRAWLVLSGGMDIFAVRLADGRAVGVRVHLFRVPPGGAFWELEVAEGQKVALLAVGLPGTRLAAVGQERLRELARQPAEAEKIRELLEKWLGNLSRVLTAPKPLPQDALLLRPGMSVSLNCGQTAISRQGVIWIAFQDGVGKYLGRDDLAPLPGGTVWFPMVPGAWVEAATDLSLQVWATDEFFSRDPEWQALDNFHRLVIAGIVRARQQLREAAFQSLDDQARDSQDFLEGSFARLAAVLQPGQALLGVEGADPLFSACYLVAAALGIVIKPPPKTQTAMTQEFRLREIARVSRFHLRQVELRGEWWRRDNGPLLGFTGPDARPVALIPDTPRSYRLADPGRHTMTKVTPEVAATLSPSAYVLYRPFHNLALTTMNLLRFSVRGMGRDFSTIFLMGAAAGLLGILTPIATGLLYNYIIPGDERGQLLHLTLILMVCAAASAMFTITRNLALLRVEGKMDYALQAAVWDHLLKLPAPFFRDYTAGDLAMRANAFAIIRQRLSSTLVTSVLTLFFSVFSFALLFYYDWELALVATGIILMASLITIVFGFLELRYQKPLFDLQGRIAGLAFQLFSGLGKLHVAAAEERGLACWAGLFSTQKGLFLSIRTYANLLEAINSLLPVAATGILFAWVVFQQQAHRLSTGNFLAFLAAFTTFFTAVLSFSSETASLLNLIPLYQRAKPILQAVPEVDESKEEPPKLNGEIEAAHLSFRYSPESPMILDEVSFRVAPGEFVALVGPSGSGKSTLFRLLLGLEEPEMGSVYYDGLDLGGLDLQSVRQQNGEVLQEGKLLAGDILSNILTTSDLGEEEAWDAARKAGLEEDIENMPMGMHTFVCEGGGTFSGGQLQRLLIARAIVKKPRILLLDEATSALDNRTQSIVTKSLEELKTTRVVIAHRLSTIVHADRILVLDKGKLVQEGTYEELLNQEGLFAELAKRQIA